MSEALDPSTPVLVGVGEASERIDDPDYRALSAVELGAAAARGALDDADADGLAASVDVIAAVRQFEISSPLGSAPLGRSTNFPRSVAGRLGIDPLRAVLDITGGQSPQKLVTEFAGEIAAGRATAVLIVGAEAISTARHLAGADDKPDFAETVDGSLEDRGFGIAGIATKHMVDHGLIRPVLHYALIENARRAARGESRADHVRSMAQLFAPMSQVAATNPHAAAPLARSVDELATPTDANRPIADPYTRYLVSRDQVNQGAAVVLTSVGEARRLGIAPQRWVFLRGHADLAEKTLLDRPSLGESPAAVASVRHALHVAGLGTDDIGVLDLYSCFAVAVSNVCDAFDLAPDDPRGLTVTGGLPFFGGPGNNYSMHAIAATVRRLRAEPGVGLVGANGGMLSKYSTGVYSTSPGPWVPDRSAEVQAELDAVPSATVDERPRGPATIETYTIQYDRSGATSAIVVGRLDGTGARFLATTLDDDGELLAALQDWDEPVGRPVYVRAFPAGNRVTTTRERMTQLRPIAAPALAQAYEHVQVRRDGHLLEVVINRPDARNALHPPANDELAAIFDAYFADPELWVAILAGAGTDSFCAGNDLMWTASGKPMSFPLTGFGGLTSRRLTKPVIAAVNGYAMGGGLELALAAHVVVADERARFALSEVTVGLVAAMGGLVRLPRSVPRAVANEMVLTGRRLTAGEALGFGLVNRVVPPGTALGGARELAAEILAASPTSIRVSLQLMAEAEGFADPLDAVTAPSTALDTLIASADTYEGLMAFASKREPRWTNR